MPCMLGIMSVQIYTAHLRYVGPGRLDVTPAGPYGEVFCPTWPTRHRWYGSLREPDQWQEFSDTYRIELKESLRQWPAPWEEILQSGSHFSPAGSVTLCCYCTQPRFCHRTLLAQFLARLGGDPKGERR